MLPNITTCSGHKPPRWDQHCLLVLQFPISFQSEVRLSARFDGVKLELLRNFTRGASKRARNLFMNPSTIPVATGSGSSAGHACGYHETLTLPHSALTV